MPKLNGATKLFLSVISVICTVLIVYLAFSRALGSEFAGINEKVESNTQKIIALETKQESMNESAEKIENGQECMQRDILFIREAIARIEAKIDNN